MVKLNDEKNFSSLDVISLSKTQNNILRHIKAMKEIGRRE